jgi:membrane protease YdiL (CAAX protease family)
MASRFSLWVEQHQLAAYFLLTFVITWGLVTPLVLSAQGLISIQLSPHWHFLGALGPISAALLVTGLAGGRPGIGEFLGRMLRWRVGAGWFFIAAFSPFVLFGLSVIICSAQSGSWPDFSRLLSREYANFGWIAGWVIPGLAYGIGEEPGWRGFALPRLQGGRSALPATIILWVLWALWHIPFFFYRFEFGLVQAAGFLAAMFAGAIWLTCLYNSTGGSILMVVLWHFTWNIVNIISPVISGEINALMSAMVMVAAAIVIIGWGPARLSPGGKHTIQ